MAGSLLGRLAGSASVKELELDNREYHCSLSDDNSKIICIATNSLAYRSERAWKGYRVHYTGNVIVGERCYNECVWIDIDSLFL